MAVASIAGEGVAFAKGAVAMEREERKEYATRGHGQLGLVFEPRGRGTERRRREGPGSTTSRRHCRLNNWISIIRWHIHPELRGHQLGNHMRLHPHVQKETLS